MEVRELHASLRERIEVGCGNLAAVTANVRPTEVVSDDQQDVGSLDLSKVGRRGRRCTSTNHEEDERCTKELE
jgi:hypothetical protein